MTHYAHQSYRRVINAFFLFCIVGAGSFSAAMKNPIAVGYGADGSFPVCVDSIKSPGMKNAFVYLFRPCDGDTLYPSVFFLHGVGAHNPAVYRELLCHIASRGYAVLYAPYAQTIAMGRPTAAYDMLRKGFAAGVEKWRHLLDSTKVGFIGHSWGGGAVPALSWEWFVKRKWGGKGTFLYIMAPWYMYDISPQQLESFPQSTVLIMQVFEDDYINDHRMAKDFFETISLSEKNKNYIVLHSDTLNGKILSADHNVPLGRHGGAPLNQLDYYGVWRLIDAVADLALRSDSVAQKIALGSGSQEQQYMGEHSDGSQVRTLTGTHTAYILYPQNWYLNFWSHKMNPRYMNTTFHNSLPVIGQRSRVTIRNYMTVRPGREIDTTFVFASHSSNDLQFSPIQKGYGAKGLYSVIKKDFPHPSLGHGKIYTFSPAEVDSPAPAIVFLHGFYWPMPDYYRGFILNLASQGYHVIFPSYLLYRARLNNKRRYDLMIEGAEEAFELLGDKVDRSRIGFIGHSYGGSAVPAVAWHFLKLKEWGKSGAFMFIISPWYVQNFRPYQFEYFPGHTRLLVQVYEHDRHNDWRMAEDLFYSFSTISLTNKDFVIVHSDKYNYRSLVAEHISPLSNEAQRVDAIDYYALYRLAGALAACSFRGDSEAQEVALGGGARQQTSMGKWPDGTPVTPMTVTDRPVTPYSQKSFVFRWNRPWNKRKRYFTPMEKAKPRWLYRLQNQKQ